MKRILLLCLLFAQVGFAQDIEKQLQRVSSLEEAEQFIGANPSLQGVVFNLYSHADTAAVYRPLFQMRAGRTLAQDGYTYKVLADTTAYFSRVSYIYLDGKKLSSTQVDSLRQLILQKLSEGVAFSELAKQYTMDGEHNGDTGWFTEGTMVEEFEKGIQKRKVQEVFTLDIPKRGLFYVVKKTFEPSKGRRLTVLRIKSSN